MTALMDFLTRHINDDDNDDEEEDDGDDEKDQVRC